MDEAIHRYICCNSTNTHTFILSWINYCNGVLHLSNIFRRITCNQFLRHQLVWFWVSLAILDPTIYVQFRTESNRSHSNLFAQSTVTEWWWHVTRHQITLGSISYYIFCACANTCMQESNCIMDLLEFKQLLHHDLTILWPLPTDKTSNYRYRQISITMREYGAWPPILAGTIHKILYRREGWYVNGINELSYTTAFGHLIINLK